MLITDIGARRVTMCTKNMAMGRLADTIRYVNRRITEPVTIGSPEDKLFAIFSSAEVPQKNPGREALRPMAHHLHGIVMPSTWTGTYFTKSMGMQAPYAKLLRLPASTLSKAAIENERRSIMEPAQSEVMRIDTGCLPGNHIGHEPSGTGADAEAMAGKTRGDEESRHLVNS